MFDDLVQFGVRALSIVCWQSELFPQLLQQLQQLSRDERRLAWRMNGIRLNYYNQANQLKEIRVAGDVGVANFSACQDVLRRVDRTFAAFFRRIKAGESAPGYPRFRSRSRYDSLTYPAWGNGCGLRPSGRLYLQGVGELKVKWHRLLPTEAKIKTVTAKREAGRWSDPGQGESSRHNAALLGVWRECSQEPRRSLAPLCLWSECQSGSERGAECTASGSRARMEPSGANGGGCSCRCLRSRLR
jgi:hypothetical protein